MPEHNFIDHVRIYCRSGAGGAGSVHFHRDKFTAKGGPDGGDGGRGGHIILKGSKHHWTLLHLRYQKHVFADKGQDGREAKKKGAQGKDKILEVPLGTIAKDGETGGIIGEVLEDGQEKIILPGGNGGLGNWHFKSATNQTPKYAQPGEEAAEKLIILELKLLADVGLVGFPNSGKSTFLSVISAAKPEIANYPFTTLTPQLGVVPYKEDKSFVVADIPGIIEGAHEGKGLGDRFLKHIERNAVLLFMISPEDLQIEHQYETLLEELRKFNPDLIEKKRIIAITKSDLLDHELIEDLKGSLNLKEPYFFISSVTGEGIEKLKERLWEMIHLEQSGFNN